MHSVGSAHHGKPVVVGVDGSRDHLATVDLGVIEARRRRAPLQIVHVRPGRYVGSRRPLTPQTIETEGRRLLEIAARRVEHQAPDLDVSTDLVDGAASAALVRRSASAQLLVIGHRDGVPTQPSWGSTAAYLAHHSVCPLLVHRGAVPETGPVVLAASARKESTATVGCAFGEAALSGSPLLAVHVWGHPPGRDVAERQNAESRLNRVLSGWRRSCPEVAAECLVIHDLDVAYALDRVSRRGRLLVAGMGRHGRTAELLYGSLGVALTRQATCPVLLVPHGRQLPSSKRQPDPAQSDQGPTRGGRSALPSRRRQT